MATGRKVARSEAVGLLEEWRASGEPLSAWCEQRGINWYSLNAHMGRMHRGAEVELAEVVITPVHDTGGRYRIEVGDVVVEVDDRFHVDTLRRLLKVVIAC